MGPACDYALQRIRGRWRSGGETLEVWWKRNGDFVQTGLASAKIRAILTGGHRVLRCPRRAANMPLSTELMNIIQHQFALDLEGIHGAEHWQRVCENGLRLAEETGADPAILELFAYLHDSRRISDGWDREHGHRAAAFVQSLQGSHLLLCEEKLELLTYACTHHSDGLVDADVTVQTCWDADRLDLGRISIQPDPQRLCTVAARDPTMIEWAVARSQ